MNVQIDDTEQGRICNTKYQTFFISYCNTPLLNDFECGLFETNEK